MPKLLLTDLPDDSIVEIIKKLYAQDLNAAVKFSQTSKTFNKIYKENFTKEDFFSNKAAYQYIKSAKPAQLSWDEIYYKYKIIKANIKKGLFKDSYDCIMQAIKHDSYHAIVLAALALGANINQSKGNLNPLGSAVVAGNLSLFNFLLLCGADIKLINYNVVEVKSIHVLMHSLELGAKIPDYIIGILKSPHQSCWDYELYEPITLCAIIYNGLDLTTMLNFPSHYNHADKNTYELLFKAAQKFTLGYKESAAAYISMISNSKRYLNIFFILIAGIKGGKPIATYFDNPKFMSFLEEQIPTTANIAGSDLIPRILATGPNEIKPAPKNHKRCLMM